MGHIGFTSILALIIIALLVIMIKFIVDGIKEKSWKKVMITVAVFCAVFALIFYGFISFIASM